MHRSSSELETLHEVGSPPSFVSGASERMFLMEFRDDRFEQVHEDDVLILLTIKFSAPHTSNHQKQKVKVLWGPRHSTRDQFIGFVRMRWFCHRPSVLCFLNHNNQIWGELDTARREFLDGDHVRLQVRSDREDWCDFEHSEITSRQLRIWEDSPPPDQVDDSSAADPSSLPDDLSQRSGLSRSRSRSRGAREDAQVDTSSYSLLQLSAARRTTRDDVDSWTPEDVDYAADGSVAPVERTHVTDRWCSEYPMASDPSAPCPIELGASPGDLEK